VIGGPDAGGRMLAQKEDFIDFHQRSDEYFGRYFDEIAGKLVANKRTARKSVELPIGR
jgi:hypothetical protein